MIAEMEEIFLIRNQRGINIPCVKRECLCCGKEFYTPKYKPAKTCSQKCSAGYKRMTGVFAEALRKRRSNGKSKSPYAWRKLRANERRPWREGKRVD